MRLQYDGSAGRETLVNLREPGRGLRFGRGEIKEVPDADARDLLRLGRGFSVAPEPEEPEPAKKPRTRKKKGAGE